MASDPTMVKLTFRADGECISLIIESAAAGVSGPLSIEQAETLSKGLEAALRLAYRARGQRKEAEEEAARLAAQESEPWGLWSHGDEDGVEHVYLGVDWPTNIVGLFPIDEAKRMRDEHNAGLKKPRRTTKGG
jgi:hypothetical protein